MRSKFIVVSFESHSSYGVWHWYTVHRAYIVFVCNRSISTKCSHSNVVYILWLYSKKKPIKYLHDKTLGERASPGPRTGAPLAGANGQTTSIPKHARAYSTNSILDAVKRHWLRAHPNIHYSWHNCRLWACFTHFRRKLCPNINFPDRNIKKENTFRRLKRPRRHQILWYHGQPFSCYKLQSSTLFE